VCTCLGGSDSVRMEGSLLDKCLNNQGFVNMDLNVEKISVEALSK